MVNPSTADAVENDQTIKKLIGFGKVYGWREFTVVNKFALRSTDVNQVALANDPDGPLNYAYLLVAMLQCDYVVVGWGSLNKLPLRLRSKWRRIAKMANVLGKTMYCIGTCKDGHPRHPQMLGYHEPLIPWVVPA